MKSKRFESFMDICENVTEKPRKRKINKEYEVFLEKYKNLNGEYLDSLSVKELIWYFREVANELGVKYFIVWQKEMVCMKRLTEQFSNREICGMIEFIFHSKQNYLSKQEFSISMLSSRWANTIYRDSQLWLDDKYAPRKNVKLREWEKKVGEESVSIGVTI